MCVLRVWVERIQEVFPIPWGRGIRAAHKSASDKSLLSDCGRRHKVFQANCYPLTSPPHLPWLASAGIFMRREETRLGVRRTLTAAEDFIYPSQSAVLYRDKLGRRTKFDSIFQKRCGPKYMDESTRCLNENTRSMKNECSVWHYLHIFCSEFLV